MVVHRVHYIKSYVQYGLVITFLLTTQKVIAEQPEWFLQAPEQAYNIMGYGQATSLEDARDLAFKDISQTLKVKVSSSTDVNKQLHNEQYDSQVIQKLKTSSSAVLIGAKVEQSIQSEGTWYVAVAYDSSSLGTKMKRTLSSYTLTKEKANYLSSTPLIRSIDEEVGVRLRYKVLRENDLWKLQYKDIKLVITEAEFIKLFSFYKGKGITLKLNKKIFYPQDNMTFSIGLKKPSYVSMLYVEANGKVGVLFANKKYNKRANYPAKNSNDDLVVANPYKKVLNEMYLAVVSQNPLNLTAFENVQSNYLDGSNYKFAELVTILDKADFSSVVVKIKY